MNVRDVDSNERTLSVQFSPHFLCKLSEYLRLYRAPDLQQPETFGLLFGAAADIDPIVQTFQVLRLPESPASSMATRYSQAFNQWSGQANANPETTWLDLLGWFSIRQEPLARLLEAEVDFHNTHFRDPSKLAILFQPRTAGLMAADFYASLPNSPLSMALHRFGSVHVPMELAGSGPIKAGMRKKMEDDLFLRAYQVASALERAEKRAEWKNRLRTLARFDWLGPGRRG